MKKHTCEFRIIPQEKNDISTNREFYCIHCLKVLWIALYSGRTHDKIVVAFKGLK